MAQRAKHRKSELPENKRNASVTSDGMDLSPFKQDIDELIKEFCEHESTSLAEMKRVWLSRKFSYIYEGSPSSNLTMYMQTLYAQSLGHMVSSESFLRRLGGLYCLYCLHETQPFKPPYGIYISLRELRSLKQLVITAKEKGVAVVSPLVKRMLDKKMFLFGSVDINEASVAETVNQLTELQNAQVQLAYKKLLANTRMKQLLLMDLDTEVDMDVIKKSLSGYAEAKKQAIKEASKVVDVQNINHIADDKDPTGEVLEGIVDVWNSKRSMFLQQTGLDQSCHEEQHLKSPMLLLENGKQDEQLDDGDNNAIKEFEQTLQNLLSE